MGRGSKDAIAAHQRSLDRADAHGGPSGSVNEVDRRHYPYFCKKYGLLEWEMADCRPYLKLDGRPSLNRRGLPLSNPETTMEEPATEPYRALRRQRQRTEDREEGELTSSGTDSEEEKEVDPTDIPGRR